MAASRPNRIHHRNNRTYVQNTHRSFLLEDYRENRYPNLQLNEIVSHVVEFARDHDGSKFIQRKLDDATENRKEAIFREMRPHLLSLMMDTFGNFVVQKFLDIGTEIQRLELLQVIQVDFMALSTHKYGCRVVQSAIEKSNAMHQKDLLLTGYNDFVLLAKNPNGNHVIQKCFRCVSDGLKDYLFGQLKSYICGLCFDLYGCRVIQCILVNGSMPHRSEIFKEIFKSNFLVRLIQDRYGNYVIQHALMFCAPTDKEQLVAFIVRNVIMLSQQKYASNVVERCLAIAEQPMIDFALLAICNRNHEDVKALCIDAYANYVVQKLIESGNRELTENLYERVRPHFKEMKRHVCGRKIIELLEQKMHNVHQ